MEVIFFADKLEKKINSKIKSAIPISTETSTMSLEKEFKAYEATKVRTSNFEKLYNALKSIPPRVSNGIPGFAGIFFSGIPGKRKKIPGIPGNTNLRSIWLILVSRGAGTRWEPVSAK